ncbi:serine O-acetyltransferase [Aureimonas leprariae]|uniref:Serine acetyltransferase n=1 Tax=Plantimonas leprariae TaxID=2615207 RepID=A0A7V7PQV0_9HYPH|nr:serine O-acetyltransferase [Aureimonas leprariae]KAB0680765.1 serine O-acetyltransferase [Aureimonas leprariae]
MSAANRASHDHLKAVDPIWENVRGEALAASENEPALAGFFYSAVLNHSSLEAAVTYRVSQRLHHADVPAALIAQAFDQFLAPEAEWRDSLRADLRAVFDRDPACSRFIEALLYFKGFHAIQTHRLAHRLLREGRRDFALYLQSRSSSVFQTDINPAARMGRGIFLDHATSIVIGETAAIGDDVSILQGVTLGGTGKETGDRHPKIDSGVLIGAGAKVLGNIRVGKCAKIAAGSVVLKPVPPCSTVAGVPARVIGTVEDCGGEPARAMNQMFDRPE